MTIKNYGNITIDDENKVVYFYGSIFSNWAHTPYKDGNGNKFITSEQHFMYLKAKFFNDERAMLKIMATDDPSAAKHIGRKIENYNEALWSKSRYEIMVDVLRHKFCNNKAAYTQLVKYKKYSFVEASAFDRIWGIGLDTNDDRIFNESEWLGENLLGKAIAQVRDEMIRTMPAEGDLH